MDAADAAQADQDAELEGALDRELTRVRTELDVLGSNLCADCGEDIPPERLRALPSAIRCIECQAFFERLGKHPAVNNNNGRTP